MRPIVIAAIASLTLAACEGGGPPVESPETVATDPGESDDFVLRDSAGTAKAAPGALDAPRFVLDGINFDTGKATVRPESFPRLDGVVEYLTYSGRSRIEISGHTDNVGNKKSNRTLSEKRAKACREYMVSKGVDGDRIEATEL